MPLYKFLCPKCKKEFESIVKMGQEYDKCSGCESLAKRTHCDLPSSPVLYGEGFYKQSKRQEVE